MIKRTVLLLVVVALAIPAAAAAKLIDVSGPATIAGHGPVRGMLRSANGPARVQFQLSGKIVVAGRTDDLVVSCTGDNVQTRTHAGRPGFKLEACLGRRMTVVVSASAFHFGAKARQWTIDVPQGVSGKISGRSGDSGPPSQDQPAQPDAPAQQ